MATVTHALNLAPTPDIGSGTIGHTVTWETLTSSNADGEGFRLGGEILDANVQIFGTFDGATVQVQGSNDDGTTWAQLRDLSGALIAITAADIVELLERPDKIRILTSGGGGSQDIDVVAMIRVSY